MSLKPSEPRIKGQPWERAAREWIKQGYSAPLVRVKLREHYGVEVSEWAVRRFRAKHVRPSSIKPPSVLEEALRERDIDLDVLKQLMLVIELNLRRLARAYRGEGKWAAVIPGESAEGGLSEGFLNPDLTALTITVEHQLKSAADLMFKLGLLEEAGSGEARMAFTQELQVEGTPEERRKAMEAFAERFVAFENIIRKGGQRRRELIELEAEGSDDEERPER